MSKIDVNFLPLPTSAWYHGKNNLDAGQVSCDTFLMLVDLLQQVVGAMFVTNNELHQGVYTVFALKVISRILAVISLLTLRGQLCYAFECRDIGYGFWV